MTIRGFSLPLGLALATLFALPAEAQRPVFPSKILSQQIDSGVTAPVAGDFTGDRIPDLVIHMSSEIRIYPGDGTGGFAAPVVTPTGAVETRRYGHAGATGDFNRDGKLDYFAFQRVFLGSGDGSLTLVATIDIEDQPRVADLNADGIPDLTGLAAGNRFLVILGSADGTFCSPSAAQCKPWREFKVEGLAVWGDVNLDGQPDLVTISPESRIETTLSAAGAGASSVVSYASYQAPGGTAIALKDVTGDGWPDLVVVSGSIYVSRGLGNGQFADSYLAVVGTRIAYSEQFNDIALADFNGDGRVDIAYSMKYDDPVEHVEVGILLGDGQGEFLQSTLLQDGLVDRTSIHPGDWNGDGLPDLVFGNTQALYLALSSPQALSHASGEPEVAPGSLASIHGLNLASSEMSAPPFATPPKTLGGTSVLVDEGSSSYSADLLYVSPSRVNFRVRPGSATGRLRGQVVGSGGSYEFSLWVRPQAPGIFTTDGVHAVAAVAASASTIDVVLYATGLNGSPASEIAVLVDGTKLAATSVFSIPGLAGLDLVRVLIPGSAACPSNARPCRAPIIRLKVGDAQSNNVVLDLTAFEETAR